MKTRDHNRSGRLPGYLLLGLGVLLLARFVGGPLLDRIAMQNWEPVHAAVMTTDLQAQRGDNGITYRATGRYRYLYRGRTYTGSRLGHAQAADNIGSWQQDMFARLADGRSQGKGIRVWVNPENPGEAIVDRDLRPGYLLFIGAFCSIPLLLGAGLVWRQRRARHRAPPGSPPWLADRNWKDNRIRSNFSMQLWWYWGFTLIWNLLNIPLLLQASEVLADRSPVAMLIFVFPLVGAGLLLWAVVKTRQWLRFGVAGLSLQPFPGVTGGQVGGQIDIRLPWSPATRAILALSCIRTCSDRSNNRRHTHRDIKWQDQTVIGLAPAQHGSRLSFRFSPPAGLPASGPAENGRYDWVLDVNIPVPGADFIRQYVIPVFPPVGVGTDAAANLQGTPAPAPDAAAGTPATSAAFSETPQVSRELLDGVLKFGYSSRGQLFSFLPYRSLKLSLLMTAMGMLFSGTGSFLYVKSDAPLPLLLVFILSGLAMFLFGIVSLGQQRDVTISPDRVRITTSYFGLERTTEVAVADVTGISKRIGYHSRGDAGYRAAYSIYLDTRSGRSIKIGDSLPGSGIADYVIGEMQKIMRLPATVVQAAASSAPETRSPDLQRRRRTRLLINGVIAIVFLLLAWNFLVKFLNHW